MLSFIRVVGIDIRTVLCTENFAKHEVRDHLANTLRTLCEASREMFAK